MRRLSLKGDKALAFIAGLLYGYRNAPMELRVLAIEEFSEDRHAKDRVYYLDRREGKLHASFNDKVTHICVVREDSEERKVHLFIYKSLGGADASSHRDA